MNKQEIEKVVSDNLNLISKMSVKEYTLYKKFTQLNLKGHINFYKENLSKVLEVKKNIWNPENLEDYLKLNVKVIPVITPEENLIWKILRTYCSTAVWSESPGRIAKFIIVDENIKKDPFGFGVDEKTHKYLGIISLGSDFLSVGGRDRKIGWTHDNKFNDKRLNYIAMGSTIVPTQPLGFNYTGGKLISLLVASNTVEGYWNKKYPEEKLSGVTTTSLYGGVSQYNSLKYWQKCESTDGKIPIEPGEDVYELIREYLQKSNPKEYLRLMTLKTESGNVKSHPKSRILQLMKKELDNLPKIFSNASRGVYWCPLYDNTESFLRNEVSELGNKKFDNSVESLVKLWKEKYAKKRLVNLLKSDRIKNKVLFYDDIVNGKWEEIKKTYLVEEE